MDIHVYLVSNLISYAVSRKSPITARKHESKSCPGLNPLFKERFTPLTQILRSITLN